jgi:hypothetical protein
MDIREYTGRDRQRVFEYWNKVGTDIPGYDCEQGSVHVEAIDNQVVNILMQLEPPEDWRKGITQAMSEILGEQSLEERLAEIRGTIERMDFRWDQGFITDRDDFMDKRLKLQQELEKLTW